MRVPLKTLISISSKSKNYFLAKSGICVKSEHCDTYAYGFGFNKVQEHAKIASQFETLEHLWATYAFHCSKKKFNGNSFVMPMKSRVFSPSEVLISSIITPGEKSADANGLGCHPVKDLAVNHAVLELIERHLLAEIWYGDGLVLEIKEKILSCEDDWEVRFYTSFDFEVPLAIAIVSNQDKGVWVLGSALKETLLRSLEHAKNEALMLLESAYIEDGIAYSKDIENRLSSLKNKYFFQRREDHFMSKIVNKNSTIDATKKFLTNEIIDKVLGINPLWIVNLFDGARFSVVRAICDAAKNPRWLRHLHSKAFPLDPFC